MANSIEQKNPDIKLNRKGNRRGLHPNSLKNLRPVKWQKGESGNPQGTSLKARLMRRLEKPLEKPNADDPAGELFIYSELIDAITRHDKDARKEIWERAEGKVAQPIGGEGGGAIKHELIINVSSETTKKALEQIMERKE